MTGGVLIPGLTPSQWISVGLILAGVVIAGVKIYKIIKTKKLNRYTFFLYRK